MEPALPFPGSAGALGTEALSQFIGLSLMSSPETACSLGPWRMRNYWLLGCFSGCWALKVKGLLDASEQAKFIQPSKASGSPEPHSVRAHGTAGSSSPQHDACLRGWGASCPTAQLKESRNPTVRSPQPGHCAEPASVSSSPSASRRHC